MSTSLPSGRQHVLVHGDQQAVVVEVGAGLRSYRACGRELLDGYAEDEMASSARGQPLIPWPNRLRDGRYDWDGEQHQLPLSEPDAGNAIHGLVRWASWSVVTQTTSAVELRHVLRPSPGYPFLLGLSLSYELHDAGLTVTTTAGNLGGSALPYAAGQHPYLLVEGQVDGCELELPAATRLQTDERGLPTGRAPVQGTAYDFGTGRPIGATELDDAFTDLARDADGRAWVTLTEPTGAAVRVWADESYPWIQLFTGDSVPDPARRRRALGVEPMTAPPSALADGVDVVRLGPGESTTGRWGMVAIR